jgi:site-specific DNA recombinase
MKAFLLARVSTDDQKDALPAQAYRLTEYAKRCNYTYELSELRESAYKGNRSSFSLVVERIKACTGLSVVVFDKIDRYTRDSSSDEVRALQALYRTGKIELHFPSDNLYIHKDSPATDLLRLGMGIVVAQYYSDAISDNVKRRFEQKLRDGEWIGRAPMGYRNNVVNGKKLIETNTLEANAVKQAYELYASSTSSLREIARMWRTEYGINAGSSKVDQVLKNPFYYGEMKIKDQLYPHKYDTLITRELFEEVKKVQLGYKIRPHRWGGLPYAYRGLFDCGKCGCRITFEKKKEIYIYGHCTQKKYKHQMKYVSEDHLTDQLVQMFRDIQIPEYAYEQVSKALKQSHGDKQRIDTELRTTVDTEIKKYQQRIEKIYEDHLDEKIPTDLYERKFSEYRNKQKLLQEKRERLELIDDTYYASSLHLLDLAKNAPVLFQKASIEQKRKLLKTVGSNFLLDGDQLRWKTKEPFKTMVLCNKKSTWLRLLGSNQRPNR